MKATVNTKIDGQYYSVGEEIHDLGNWESTESKGNQRNYVNGASTEVSKLPHYVETGSTAMTVDTGDYYIFSKEKDEWILQG